MDPDPQACEAKRLELIAGIVSVADVVAWADDLITQSDTPGDQLIRLSLSGDSHPFDVVSLLREMSGGCDAIMAIRSLLGRMQGLLVEDPSRARGFARALYEVAHEHFPDLPDDLGWLCGIDEDFYLAEEGIWTHAQVVSAFMKFLEDSACTPRDLKTEDAP